jgi:hypothetical protein
MYATIRLSPYIHIQGRITRELPGGAIAVEIGGREVIGPAVVAAKTEAAPQQAAH